MVITETEKIIKLIERGAGEVTTDIHFLEDEIRLWKTSPKRMEQIAGERYYEGYHDIQLKKREAFVKDNETVEVKSLPNNKILDNQYAVHVDRKVNYLVGKPFLISTEDETYAQALKIVFNRNFLRKLKSLVKHSINGGIAWLCPYYDSAGEFRFKVFPAYECLPLWADSEHTILDRLVRLYTVEVYDGRSRKTVEKVEVYSKDGIERYELKGDKLEYEGTSPYLTVAEGDTVFPQNWTRIPVIPFKYNDREKPLLRDCKSLQDAINKILSIFEDNMETDAWSTILVIQNYDGEGLAEFRRNLATYGAVKVRSESGAPGGIDKLEVVVNAENYKAILEILKKKLIENARSFDAKDDRVGSNANQMNLQSMYSDIDLDANGMETEYQAAFEELLFFVNAHLSHINKGNFEGVNVEFKFDRDMLMNETDIISGINQSVGILSQETLIENHPYVIDKDKELQRVKKEREEEMLIQPIEVPNE